MGDNVVDEVVGHLEDELEYGLEGFLKGKQASNGRILLDVGRRVDRVAYLFSVGGEPFAFSTTSNLSNESVKHLLAQDPLSITFENVTRMLLDRWLTHD